jgi:uncharacterized protein (TIGR03085 family)
MPFVETERQALAASFRATDPEAPTLCRGWQARHLLAHLVQREHDLVSGVGDLVVRREPGQEKFLGRLADRARSPQGYEALVDRFLGGPPRWSPMSWAGENINLVEYVIHHEDLRRGRGPVTPRALPEDEARSIWAKLGLFGRLGFRQSPVGVILARPGGQRQTVKQGAPEVTVTGEPVELALYASGRREAADVTITGAPEALSRFESWAAPS